MAAALAHGLPSRDPETYAQVCNSRAITAKPTPALKSGLNFVSRALGTNKCFELVGSRTSTSWQHEPVDHSLPPGLRMAEEATTAKLHGGLACRICNTSAHGSWAPIPSEQALQVLCCLKPDGANQKIINALHK